MDFRAFAKNLAKAATRMGLAKSLRKIKMKDASMRTPFCCGIFGEFHGPGLPIAKHC
jgi:hypothetical protein